MIKHEIYEVFAKIVDANGGYSNMQGYPKTFDSHQNKDDIDATHSKAMASFHAALSEMYPLASNRQKQFVYIIRASDGVQIEREEIGEITGYPDPEGE